MNFESIHQEQYYQVDTEKLQLLQPELISPCTNTNNNNYIPTSSLLSSPKHHMEFSHKKIDNEHINIVVTDKKSIETGTVASGAINLAATVLGAAILGLPGAFAETGYIVGVVLLIIACLFAMNGLMLLSRSASVVHESRLGCSIDDEEDSSGDGFHTKSAKQLLRHIPHESFYTVANASVPRLTLLIDLAVALKCFGVSTGYMITFADCMVHAMIGFGFKTHNCNVARLVWVLIAFLLTLPNAFHISFDRLKYTSAVSFVVIGLLLCIIVLYAEGFEDACALDDSKLEGHSCIGKTEYYRDIPSTVKSLPIFIFAFTCHQNIFPVFNEMKDRTQAKIDSSIIRALAFSLVVYLVVAVEGYRTYGSNSQSDLVNAYPITTLVTIMRISVALTVMLHYPLQLDPARRCLLTILAPIGELSTSKRRYHRRCDHDGLTNNNSMLFYLITWVFLITSTIIALHVDDLGLVFAVVGATGSTAVTYLLPGVIYLFLDTEYNYFKVLAYLQVSAGCLVIPLCLYFILYS